MTTLVSLRLCRLLLVVVPRIYGLVATFAVELRRFPVNFVLLSQRGCVRDSEVVVPELLVILQLKSMLLIVACFLNVVECVLVLVVPIGLKTLVRLLEPLGRLSESILHVLVGSILIYLLWHM